MKNKSLCKVIIVFIILIFSACSRSETIYQEDSNYFAYTRSEIIYQEDSKYFTTGVVIYIKGSPDDEWIIPETIDMVGIKIKEHENNNEILIIALRDTIRYGDIKVGNTITVYWFEKSPVFSSHIPTYVASHIVSGYMSCSSLILERERFWWHLYSTDGLDEYYRRAIENANLPHIYSRNEFDVLTIPIIAYGTKMDEFPIVNNDGVIMVPLQSAIGNSATVSIGLGNDIYCDGSLVVVVSDGSIFGIRIFSVGSTVVVKSGGRLSLCTPPIIVEGMVYVPFVSFFRYIGLFGFTTAYVYDDRLEIVYSPE